MANHRGRLNIWARSQSEERSHPIRPAHASRLSANSRGPGSLAPGVGTPAVLFSQSYRRPRGRAGVWWNMANSGCEDVRGQEGESFLYFAYGSNLLTERIHLRNPSAAFCCVARLQVSAAGARPLQCRAHPADERAGFREVAFSGPGMQLLLIRARRGCLHRLASALLGEPALPPQRCARLAAVRPRAALSPPADFPREAPSAQTRPPLSCPPT